MNNTNITVVVAASSLLAGGVLLATIEPVKEVPVTETSYFAEIDREGMVLRVIVADQAFIDSGAVGDPATWVQTYPDGDARKNYAGKGFRYDTELNAFVSPKPVGPDFVLDKDTATWKNTRVETFQASSTLNI